MSVLYLDELNKIEIPGSMSKPKNIVLSAMMKNSYVDVLDENYYAGFDGNISLDYRRIVRSLVPRPLPVVLSLTADEGLNVSPVGYMDMKISSEGSILKQFTANNFELDDTPKITDIDYLAAPRNAMIAIAIPAIYMSQVVTLYIRNNNVAIAGFSRSNLAGDGKGYYQYMFNLADFPAIKSYDYLKIRVLARDMAGTQMLWSTEYQIIPGDYQQFLFGGRLGGYVSFPMAGSLEYAPEYDMQNCTLSDSVAKVKGSKSPVFRQHSGGLTGKAAAALADLMLADDVYHYADGTWRKIIISNPSLSVNSIDSLHYASFNFRYAEV